jgi:hypothetical protein
MIKGVLKAMFEIERVCRGKCAKCGSEHLEYEETEFNGDEVYFNFKCSECGCSGSEAYKLNYISTITYVDGN